MDNKFQKLKKEYRDFVTDTAERIIKLDINTNLTKSKCVAIYNLYNEIYDSIEKSVDLNINDINHIIINYTKNDNSYVELIKKFIQIKNIYIIKCVIKSNLFNTFISKYRSTLDFNDSELNKQISEYLVSKAIYKLLMSFVNHFRGPWEIVDFKDGKVLKINIIEPEHILMIEKYIKNKIIKN
jgi:hypothetical protein